MARELAGLTLKPTKCVVVPLHTKFSSHVASIVRDAMCRLVPRWSAFQIKGAAKYLGIWMGPAAGAAQWHAQVDKWWLRVGGLAAQYPSVRDLAGLYRSRCVSVLPYVAQLKAAPYNLKRTEAAIFCKMMRIPWPVAFQKGRFQFPGSWVPKVSECCGTMRGCNDPLHRQDNEIMVGIAALVANIMCKYYANAVVFARQFHAHCMG